MNEFYINEKCLTCKCLTICSQKNLGKIARSLILFLEFPPPRDYACMLCNHTCEPSRPGEVREDKSVQQKNRRSASHHRNDCAHANTSEKLIVRSIRANPKGLTLENFLAGCAECPWPSNSSFTSNSKVERFFTKSQQSFQF